VLLGAASSLRRTSGLPTGRMCGSDQC